MHKTTMKVIHWIWSEPVLADFLREIAAGDPVDPDGVAYEYGDVALACWISDLVYPEDRARGAADWVVLRSHGVSESRVDNLYDELTKGRKDPNGRLAWLNEMEPNLVRDALLGHKGDSDIYVHATAGRFHPNNRYRVHDRGTVYEPGWTAASGSWGLMEGDRQVCPVPIGTPCSCEVVRSE